MKLNLILLFCVALNFCFGQLSFYGVKNLDIYKPYTQLSQNHVKYKNIQSKIFQAGMDVLLLKRQNICLKTGLIYKNINFVVGDRIHGYYKSSKNGDYILYIDSTDLKSTSRLVGIPIAFNRLINSESKLSFETGLRFDFFVYEKFHSWYSYKYEPNGLVKNYPILGTYRRFMNFNNIQFSINVVGKYKINERSSIGIRLQAGTNLYSNWDQFKRYAWLGVGLEWEIGKKVKNGS
jgi:hypothetical protein